MREDPATSDLERPLNDRGRRDSKDAGRYLAARSASPELVLCSPSVRTRQTAELVLGALAPDVRLEIRPALYLASAETALDEIGRVDATMRAILLIGHNPGLELLARWLAGAVPSHASERLQRGLKTANLAGFDVACNDWSELDPTRTVLTHVLRPREDF